jgi:hypothetical protein
MAEAATPYPLRWPAGRRRRPPDVLLELANA